ncbi:hypothetical protein FQR65_LT02930 [Abscondita terminalis]|nr:hypothetical protein FQR65_LT02930 [Abscondita terminalis]
MKELVCFIIIFSFGFCAKLIEQFKICKRSDPNLNDCLKDAIQEALPLVESGTPEFGIPSMNPVKVPSWIVKKKPPLLTFEQIYSDLEVHHLTKAKVNSVQAVISDNDLFLQLKLYNPLIKFITKYDYKDAVLMEQNITGQGYATFLNIDSQMEVNISGRVVPKTDKTVLEEITVVLDVEVDHVDTNLEHFHFEFDRNNSEHLNKYSKLFTELSRGYFDMIINDIILVSNSIFQQIDYNLLFPK